MPRMLDGLPVATAAVPGTVSLVIDKNIKLPSPEGYVLEINGKQVTIKAVEQAGLFYGIQTLNQLLEDSHDQQIEIPSCRITDYPEIPYRAIHVDVKHHLDVGNIIMI
jgi:N-acetyl-beta-hexosaminidase